MLGFFVYLKVTGNLKTFIKIMVKLYFKDFEDNDSIQVVAQEIKSKEIDFLTLEILLENGYPAVVRLDKSTAIKFSKEVRKQIALLD